jgi:hypothetical protein
MNYNNRDVFVYFLVSDMFVRLPVGKYGNYALFDWVGNHIASWSGLDRGAFEWAENTLKKSSLLWGQIREIHRREWETRDE